MKESGTLSKLNDRWTRTWGPNQGASAAMAIHGILTHSLWFGPLGDALASSGKSLICADRAGAGLNQQDTGKGDLATAEAFLDDELKLARSLKQSFEKVHLVAWCGTVSHGIVLAHRHPEIFSSLTLVAPLFFGTTTDFMNMAIAAFAMANASTPDADLVDCPNYAAGLVDESMADLVHDDALLLRRMTPRLMKNFAAYIPESMDLIPKIKIPVRAILANRDRLTDPDKATAFLRSQLSADHLSLVDGPHACWLADGGATARLLATHM